MCRNPAFDGHCPNWGQVAIFRPPDRLSWQVGDADAPLMRLDVWPFSTAVRRWLGMSAFATARNKTACRAARSGSTSRHGFAPRHCP